MLINILVRTCYRPELFNRMMKSIRSQTYQDIRVIVSYDDDRALEYIPDNYERIRVQRGEGYAYNLYCNQLKEMVTDGYFIFLDDDDFFATPHVLAQLCALVKQDHCNIVKLDRKGKIYPRTNVIMSGQIGMPCMVLHHTHKNISDIALDGRGDSVWILKAIEKLATNFIDLVVVYSDRKGSGKTQITKELYG